MQYVLFVLAQSCSSFINHLSPLLIVCFFCILPVSFSICTSSICMSRWHRHLSWFFSVFVSICPSIYLYKSINAMEEQRRGNFFFLKTWKGKKKRLKSLSLERSKNILFPSTSTVFFSCASVFQYYSLSLYGFPTSLLDATEK